MAGLGWGLTLALSFELARLEQTYEYRGFLKALIGPGWIAFEILFVVSLLIVLAVNGSAAGSVLNDQLGVPSLVGVGLMFAAVIGLNYVGRTLLAESMSICMIALCLVLIIYSAMTFIQFHDSIALTFREAPSQGNWMARGLQYMLYSTGVVPVLLYSARDIQTRGEAIVSGFTAGLLGVFPALVFHFTFMADPASLGEKLPTYYMIGKLAESVAHGRVHHRPVRHDHPDLRGTAARSRSSGSTPGCWSGAAARATRWPTPSWPAPCCWSACSWRALASRRWSPRATATWRGAT